MLGIPLRLEIDLCHNSKAKEENSRVVSENEVVARAQSRTPIEMMEILHLDRDRPNSLHIQLLPKSIKIAENGLQNSNSSRQGGC